MNLNELIKMRGFDISNKKIKLVRHQDSNYDTKLLYKLGMLDFYQSVQSNDIFRDCNYIFSFLGDERGKAIFIGAYEKLSNSIFDLAITKVPSGYPYMDILSQPLFHYEFKPLDLLNDLIERLVIDWGTSNRSWHQWLIEDRPKPVVEILPTGYTKEFPGFVEVYLSFDELSKIILYPDPHRIWHTMLSSVAGVYLILDSDTGNQYVGSASGQYGILGRWKSYVETLHGNNLRLIQLLKDEPERYKSFKFSILHTLPRSMTPVQVFAFESIYKQKLGSRAFGLNAN